MSQSESERRAGIAEAPLHARGAMRGIGAFVALDFACYSFLGLFFSWAFLVSLSSLVLLPVWFVLAGGRIEGERTMEDI